MKYRNKKSGKIYEKIGVAQCKTEGCDKEGLVVYRDEKGLYAREQLEFSRKFERVEE